MKIIGTLVDMAVEVSQKPMEVMFASVRNILLFS